MPTSRPKTVLVIDDEPDILELVGMVLQDEGYRVETAGHGLEALEIISSRMPDLILLDMKMPVMDGPAFAREFHARYDGGVPIVVITAAADALNQARDIGADDSVGKPFELDQLAKVVKRHLRG